MTIIRLAIRIAMAMTTNCRDVLPGNGKGPRCPFATKLSLYGVEQAKIMYQIVAAMFSRSREELDQRGTHTVVCLNGQRLPIPVHPKSDVIYMRLQGNQGRGLLGGKEIVSFFFSWESSVQTTSH